MPNPNNKTIWPVEVRKWGAAGILVPRGSGDLSEGKKTPCVRGRVHSGPLRLGCGTRPIFGAWL